MMRWLALLLALLPGLAAAQYQPGDVRIDQRDVRICTRAGCVAGGDGLAAETAARQAADAGKLATAETYTINLGALGAPTSGYLYTAGTSSHTATYVNNGGYNYGTGGNTGRTGAVFNRFFMTQNGAGDANVMNFELTCSGAVGPGVGGPYTDWLGVPACGVLNGDLNAGLPGQYLQETEFHFFDNAYDVSTVGTVRYYVRSAATANQNNRWVDEIAQCNLGLTGPHACDAKTVVQGNWRIGYDFMEIGTNVAAPLAMQAGQKIVFAGSWGDGEGNPAAANFGGEWLTADNVHGVTIASNGGPAVRLANSVLNAVNYPQLSGALTGGAPALTAAGLDPIMPMILADKGGGGAVLMSNGNIVAKAVAGSQASSYLQLNPGATAGSPFLLQALSASQTDIALQGAVGGAVHAIGTFVLDTATPASSSASCRTGQVTFDSSYAYFCVGTNSWRRTSLASW